MHLGRHELDLEEAATSREWLLANGLGGFASSTVGGRNTRRYHGWLVPHVARYGGRFVVLSKLEEEVTLDGLAHDLDHRHLQGFDLAPLPVFTYHLGGFFVERTVFVPHGENRVVAVYWFASPGQAAAALRLRPLVTFRFYHHLMRANDWPFRAESGPGWVTVEPHAGSPVLVLRYATSGGGAAQGGDSAGGAGGAAWAGGGGWRIGLDYLEERRRGLDSTEDLYVPGRFDFTGLGDGARVAVSAALAETEADLTRLRDEPWDLERALEEQAREERRLRSLAEPVESLAESIQALAWPAESPAAPTVDRAFLGALARAADAFVAVRGGGAAGRRTTIIAGYPWFEDWGRDTLISLPGLLLVTGRLAEALEILRDYAGFVRDGLVPNRFPDQAADPDYNTADASLWLFWAVQYYLAYASASARPTGQGPGGQDGGAEALALVRSEFAGPLSEIATSYLEGTRYGIGTDADGLVHAGEPGYAVTWMDAKLGDWVVTPRRGCPVEINALWYNALRFLAELESPAGANGDRWAALANRVRSAFNARFWDDATGCLYDVVPPATAPGVVSPTALTADPAVRPNQILAVSLPYPVLEPSRWRAVVDVCFRDLYATCGLRTLSPSDPGYRRHYRGGPSERDGAYHQGTAWPWLLGPFITTLRRTHGRSEASRRIADRIIRPFAGHLREAGVGYISEVFDGDYPFMPGGCVAQAWSVAEILRAYVEEVLDRRPPGLDPAGRG